MTMNTGVNSSSLHPQSQHGPGQHYPGLSVSLRQMLETNVLSEADHLTQQDLYYYMLVDDTATANPSACEDTNTVTGHVSTQNEPNSQPWPKVIPENKEALHKYLDTEIQKQLDKFLKQWTRMQSVIGITLDKVKAATSTF